MDTIEEILLVLLPIYILIWLVVSAMTVLGEFIWKWWRSRTRFGRLEMLRLPPQMVTWRDWLSQGIFFGLGIWAGSYFLKSTPRLWMILIVGLVMLLLEELREPKCLVVLPEVVQFLNRYRSAIVEGHDVYGALAAAAEDLPRGEVLYAVDRALEKQIHHLPHEVVFKPLEKVTPSLQEFVLILKNNGWKGSKSLETGLEMIFRRSVKEDDQARRKRLRFKQIKPIIILGKAWLAGIIMAVIHLSMSFVRLKKLVGELNNFLLFLMLLILGLLFFLIFSQSWTRRVIIISCISILFLFSGEVEKEKKVIASVQTAGPTVIVVTPTIRATRPIISIISTKTFTPMPTSTPKKFVRRGKSPAFLPENTKSNKCPLLYTDFGIISGDKGYK